MLAERNPLQNIQVTRKQLQPLRYETSYPLPSQTALLLWPVTKQVSEQTTTNSRRHEALSNSATGVALLWMGQIYWRLELGRPLSRYTNHKANPGTQLFSTFFFWEGWREKDCICLDLIFLIFLKFSLPKKTVPCAALITSNNHPKWKWPQGLGASCLTLADLLWQLPFLTRQTPCEMLLSGAIYRQDIGDEDFNILKTLFNASS